MHICEYTMENDLKQKYLLIVFYHFKNNEVYRDVIVCDSYKTPEDLLERKLQIVQDFLNKQSSFFLNFTERDILKAWGKIDGAMLNVYKHKFPRGGYHGGGRPKGSRTDKTERVNLAVTPDERAAILDFLENYRKSGKLEGVRAELAPYLKQIDESFGDNEVGREKWRKRMLNTNPAMLPYMLEHFKIFGVEKSIAAAKKQYSKSAPASVIDDNLTDKEMAYLKDSLERYRMRHKLIDNPEPKKQVSDEYVKAFEECIEDEKKKCGRLRTLDEAYKEYQEKHKGDK